MYKYNPDTSKIHNVPNKTGQCNFSIMDGDETNFRAQNDSDAMRIAKIKWKFASKCQHCM